jgi:hypothetical protein
VGILFLHNLVQPEDDLIPAETCSCNKVFNKQCRGSRIFIGSFAHPKASRWGRARWSKTASTIAVRFRIRLLAETPFSCRVSGNNNKSKIILKRVSQKWVMQELIAIALVGVQRQASLYKVLGLKPWRLHKTAYCGVSTNTVTLMYTIKYVASNLLPPPPPPNSRSSKNLRYETSMSLITTNQNGPVILFFHICDCWILFWRTTGNSVVRIIRCLENTILLVTRQSLSFREGLRSYKNLKTAQLRYEIFSQSYRASSYYQSFLLTNCCTKELL